MHATGAGRPSRGQANAFVKEQAATKPTVNKFVTIATKPGSYFGMTPEAVDLHRLLTDSCEDLIVESNRRLGEGQRVGCLGATLEQFYVTFVKAGSTAREEFTDSSRVPTMRLFTSVSELREAIQEDAGYRTVTHMACLSNVIVALFEALFDGENCSFYTHKGNLTANTLHEPENRRNIGLLAGSYYSADDIWLFIFSNMAPVEEKWSVGPLLDRSFIQRGFDEGYCIRKLMASKNQWFILMQRNDQLCSTRQSILYTMTTTLDFEMRMWENGFVITSCCGNLPAGASPSAAAAH